MGVDVEHLPFKVRYHSLHDTKFSRYSDKFTGERHDGIAFHPTYEAKMWRWLRQNTIVEQDGSTGFWIVGSAPSTKVIEPFYTRAAA